MKKLDYYRLRVTFNNLLNFSPSKSIEKIRELMDKFGEIKVIKVMLGDALNNIAFFYDRDYTLEKYLNFYKISLEDLLYLVKRFHKFRENYIVFTFPKIIYNYIGWAEKVKRFSKEVFRDIVNKASDLFGIKLDLSLVFDERFTGAEATSDGSRIIMYGDLLFLSYEDEGFEKKILKKKITGVLAHEVFHSAFSKILGRMEHLYRTGYHSVSPYHEFIADMGRYLFFNGMSRASYLYKNLNILFEISLDFLISNKNKEAFEIGLLYNPEVSYNIYKKGLPKSYFVSKTKELLVRLSYLYSFLEFNSIKRHLKVGVTQDVFSFYNPRSVMDKAISFLETKLKKGENILPIT